MKKLFDWEYHACDKCKQGHWHRSDLLCEHHPQCPDYVEHLLKLEDESKTQRLI